MAAADRKLARHFTVLCARCERPLAVRRAWVGREVRCPHCASILRVPPVPADGRPARAAAPALRPRQQFNFGCPRCQTLLETHTGMSGQPGRCPTCAARLVIPDLDPTTGMPRPAVLLDDEGDQIPTPLHAYAASGTQAPQIRRRPDGTQAIECPRCAMLSSVDADSCEACGTPFTIEAAPTVSGQRSDTWAATAAVLGIISLPLFFLLLPAVLAVALGLMSLRLGMRRGVPGTALLGIALGLVSLAAGLLLWLAL